MYFLVVDVKKRKCHDHSRLNNTFQAHSSMTVFIFPPCIHVCLFEHTCDVHVRASVCCVLTPRKPSDVNLRTLFISFEKGSLTNLEHSD